MSRSLFEKNCFICNAKIHSDNFCGSCRLEISALWIGDQKSQLTGTLSMCAFFKYEDPLRQIILDAKVNGSIRAIHLLRQLWGEGVKRLGIVVEGATVIGAPSSLWSRLRGRVDLASLLAYDLTEKGRWNLERPPRSLAWRLQKRAQLGTRAARLEDPLDVDSAVSFADLLQISEPVLLIDDIVTTGFTMKNLANYIKAPSISCLALAAVVE